MINLVLCGQTGSMGEALRIQLQHNEKFQVLGYVSPRKNMMGEGFSPDVIIDFSRPDNLDFLLDYAKEKNARLMLCTTGYTEQQMNKIKDYSKEIPVLFSSNTAIGIYLMRHIIQVAAASLKDFDIEIVERHHKTKLDAPSGTAKTLRNDLLQVTGQQDIPVHSLRIGTVISDHEVIFAGDDELLEIRHTALSNRIFASGALRLAEKFIDHEKGFYETRDMIM